MSSHHRTATNVTSTNSNPVMSGNTHEFNDVDSTKFSDFVKSMQLQYSEFQSQIADIDWQVVANDSMKISKILMDNLFAGDWLNRGELYGALQLLFILFILQKQIILDFIITFLSGPLLVLIGSIFSFKAVNDLGFKQLSIWPAPVPNCQLSSHGLYSIIRHPIYTGLLISSVGFAISTASPARLAFTIAMFLFLVKKIDVEEQFLLNTYPEYEEYMQKVPFKFIPHIF